jgi:hypothetical protein
MPRLRSGLPFPAARACFAGIRPSRDNKREDDRGCGRYWSLEPPMPAVGHFRRNDCFPKQTLGQAPLRGSQ